jgi:3-deoxy-D-manno-octulosonic-acid transferase
MIAAAPLVAALGASGHRVLLTTGTAAGLLTGVRLKGEQPAIDGCVYLPWDRRAVRGWLRVLAPAAVVVVETEIWPNLFIACKDLRIPLFIANGRIRPRDVWKYRLGRRLFRGVLDSARWIGVQSTRERDAFVAIGAEPARVEVAGNLKFDAAWAARSESAGLAIDGDGRPLVVAGSTHDPEERWLFECARTLAGAGRRIRLVVAPRDVARAAAVVRLARSSGLRPLTWSEWSDNTTASWDVIVLDRYATLRPCYSDADVVVMGGTFVRVGGHNILEAAAAAKPILVGPQVDEIAALIDLFAAAGAVMRLPGSDPAPSLADACRTLFDDPARARLMGEAASDVCRQGAGSADRHARAIVDRMAAPAR